MRFIAHPDPTVGCEWELQLLREDTLELAGGILAFSDELGKYALIKPEFLQCCIEINTAPVDAAADLERALNAVCSRTSILREVATNSLNEPFDAALRTGSRRPGLAALFTGDPETR